MQVNTSVNTSISSLLARITSKNTHILDNLSFNNEIFKGRKISLVILRKEQWDSNSYLERSIWSWYSWAAKQPRSPFTKVKWETKKYVGAYNAFESTCAGVCNALHLEVHMQKYAT